MNEPPASLTSVVTQPVPTPVTRPHPPLTGRHAARHVGFVAERCLPIFIHEPVLDRVLEYSDQSADREVGGFLLGSHFRDPSDGEFIEISDYLPASSVTSQYRWLTFTHDTWSRLHQHIDQQSGKDPHHQRLVGWHHTHPGFGIFLSRHDQFIHRNFFNLPWQVALVVDPRRQELGFFQWQDQQIVNSGFVCVPASARRRTLGKTPRNRITSDHF